MTTVNTPDPTSLPALLADVAALKVELRALYVRWCVAGPTLEASSALAAMAQEETGHARVLARLAGEAEAVIDATEVLGGAAVTDWPSLVGHAGPVEVALASVTAALRGVGDPEVQRNLAKIAVEERSHADFFTGCLLELAPREDAAGARFRSTRTDTEKRLAPWLDHSTVVLGDSRGAASGALDGGTVLDVPCVHCGSRETRLSAAFGGSLLTSLMQCAACGSQFEAVRWR
ncbi:Phenylacetic acid catabolic protein [Nocardioides humi]|uniref:PaaD zinc beta ribbon domain-containing protein n=1 Tax=Nocardioides humi TaxID=449461 RepID=A0ABN2ACB7_9ACTN|nr:Phenylacetic acid catabolic protein [Nocardioides humi]